MVQIWYKNKLNIGIKQELDEKYEYKNMVQLVEFHHILLLIFMWIISLPQSLRHPRDRRCCLRRAEDRMTHLRQLHPRRLMPAER